MPDNLSRRNISEDFGIICFLDQDQIDFQRFWDQYFWWFSSRGNISDDFGSGFFSGSVPDDFSMRNISEDFGRRFFLDQDQIDFLREIFLRAFGSEFFLEQCQLVFLGSYFWWFCSRGNISEDFGSGFFLDQCQIAFIREIFLRILAADFFWSGTSLFF